MARNLERKVACEPDALCAIQDLAARFGVRAFTRLTHVDTYFRVPAGRLKLREIGGDDGASAELIGYHRADASGSRWSEYERAALEPGAAAGVRRVLALTCGVLATVAKTRTIAIWSRTRIHLDAVDGLGAFVELETVAGPDDDDGAILAEHEAVIAALELCRWPVVAGSYGDLMAEREGNSA